MIRKRLKPERKGAGLTGKLLPEFGGGGEVLEKSRNCGKV